MKLYLPLISTYFLLTIHQGFPQDSIQRQNDTLQAIIDRSNEAYDAYNYKEALAHAEALIDKGKKYDKYYYVFLGYDLLGGIYSEIDDTVQGRMYSEKALEIARAMQSDSLIAWGALNLAILHSDNKDAYGKTIDFFQESIDLNTKIKDFDEVYLTYVNLAWTYLEHKEIEKARAILKKADALSKEIKADPLDELYIKMLWGRYFLEEGKPIEAQSRLEPVAMEVDRDSITDLALEVYQHLGEAYERTGDYKNAYTSLSKYNGYRKKAMTNEKIEETAKAKAKFDLRQTQKDLNAALQEKEYSERLAAKSKSLTTILIVATFILILALLGFYLYFNTRKTYIKRLHQKNKELTLAKEEAEKLSKVKTRFLSTVSHELRTPLYAVIGISTLLEQEEPLKEYRDDLKSLKFSADYLLALINDVLTLGKVDADAITLSRKKFELESLIQNIIRPFEQGLQENRNQLHYKIDPNIPNSLVGDSTRLSQIIMNLLGNAVKFTENGHIWIELDLVETLDNHWYRTRFVVRDNGPGIPNDKQHSIFEEFSQIGNEKKQYQGTGLGLTIVKKLLLLFDSDIQLESKPGLGSKFSFIIDLEKNTDFVADNGDTGKEQSASDLILSRSGLKVLLVEDNKINQRVTQKILQKYGIESLLAEDGKQAVEMARSKRYDLILMDINMPKVNGLEAARRIRKFDEITPIIALTAVELDDMRRDILNAGINDILHKPYSLSEFIDVIQKNLSSKTDGEQ